MKCGMICQTELKNHFKRNMTGKFVKNVQESVLNFKASMLVEDCDARLFGESM
jgi:hypothetical protein